MTRVSISHRIMHKRTQPGTEKWYPPGVYLIRKPEGEALQNTPGPGHYSLDF